MEAYKFETTVLEDGIIKLPQLYKYANQKIEVFIVFKDEEKKEKQKLSAKDFLNKWTGFISVADSDLEKYKYLTNKYK